MNDDMLIGTLALTKILLRRSKLGMTLGLDRSHITIGLGAKVLSNADTLLLTTPTVEVEARSMTVLEAKVLTQTKTMIGTEAQTTTGLEVGAPSIPATAVKVHSAEQIGVDHLSTEISSKTKLTCTSAMNAKQFIH